MVDKTTSAAYAALSPAGSLGTKTKPSGEQNQKVVTRRHGGVITARLFTPGIPLLK